MGYKKTHKYFDRDSDPWRRKIMDVEVKMAKPPEPRMYVIFDKGHHAMSSYTKSFIGKVGEVTLINHDETEYHVQFKRGCRWIKVKWLKTVLSPEESADLAAEAEGQYC